MNELYQFDLMASKCFHGIIEREALGNKQKILLCRPEVVSLKQIAFNIFNIKLRLFAQSFQLRLKIHCQSLRMIGFVASMEPSSFQLQTSIKLNNLIFHSHKIICQFGLFRLIKCAIDPVITIDTVRKKLDIQSLVLAAAYAYFELLHIIPD